MSSQRLKAAENAWYKDWQDEEHTRQLDGRSVLPGRSLIRNYEKFTDVQLLNDHLKTVRDPKLLEVGCATGEFYRYLRLKHPRASYAGLDISQSAVQRAQQKYSRGRFFVSDPGQSLSETLKSHRLDSQWPVVYSKDVVHHQTDPFGFLAQLIGVCSDTFIFRTRTRDRGPTLADPEQSCQYHYQGWMPFIVLNLDELMQKIQQLAPGSDVVAYRNHMVLGGKENRFLPKECYLPETGTAETSIAVLRHSGRPNRVRVFDRTETSGSYPLMDRIALRLRGGPLK